MNWLRPRPSPSPRSDRSRSLIPEPEFEAEHEPGDEVAIESGRRHAAFGASTGPPDSWDPKRDGNRRSPTTAEQAVPWLIGIILALAGIVIVLLALIFSSPGGLVASEPTASPQASGSVQPGGRRRCPFDRPERQRNASPSAPEETPQPTTQEPAFGPLEMTYLGRPSAVAPIYLLIRDFSVAKDPDVLAQAPQGVSSYANAPDGKVSAAIIDGRAVALREGQEVTTAGRQRHHPHLRLGLGDAVRGAHHQGRRQ